MLDILIKKLSLCWKTYTEKQAPSKSLNSQFLQHPSENEPITVFATNGRDFRADGTARHTPFMPSNKYGNTSCFRTLNLLAQAIWEIAEKHVCGQNRKIYGRFDLYAKAVYQQRLKFDPNNQPPRHANIVNWPSDNKSAQRSLAQQVAAESIFHVESSYQSYVAQVSYNKMKKCLCGIIDFDDEQIMFDSETVKKIPEEMEKILNRSRHV